MRKFKLFFYGVYLLYFAFIAFIALYYEDMVLRWDWDFIDTWTGLIRFVLKLGGIGTVLFITEIIVENIHLYSKNRKVKSLETEVQDLKARLYDKSIDSSSTTDDAEANTPIEPENPETSETETNKTPDSSTD